MSPDLVREAAIEGRRLAIIHCFDRGGITTVEAEVLPAGATQPVLCGPYQFETVADAHRMVQEAALALRYLGCDVR